jgi:hypothetical protein
MLPVIAEMTAACHQTQVFLLRWGVLTIVCLLFLPIIAYTLSTTKLEIRAK